MSDGTKSGYTKTGKKVRCINSNRRDLTYKKVYDVFIDVNGDEFVIDEAGDWSYDSMEFPLWCEVFDDTADTTNKVNTTNETKLKFKHAMSPYRVEIDDGAHWWLTDKCIELVNDDNTIENNHTESAPIVSDGGSSSYYAQQIPKGMLKRFNTTGIIEAKDIIRLFLGNDFNMGNIFKAYCRIISLRNGKGKAGIDEQYDLTKVKYFSEDELNYYLENKDV